VRLLPGRPFLRKVDIARFKARHRFWPPPDASPVIPMEPWGKQVFVYNSVRNVELVGDSRAPDWGNARPQWWREDIALSFLKEGEDPNQILSNENVAEEGLNEPENQTHTHVCVTDFRQRPLMYLSREELETVRENLEFFKSEMTKFESRIPKNVAEEIEREQLATEDDKYMHIRRGRMMNPPSRTGRGVMSSPNRPPKKKPPSN
jgi:hypothetical protein